MRTALPMARGYRKLRLTPDTVMTMNFGGGYSIGYIIVLIADIYAILNVLQSSEENLKKALWVALILVLPLVGVILWYFLGPRARGKLL